MCHYFKNYISKEKDKSKILPTLDACLFGFKDIEDKLASIYNKVIKNKTGLSVIIGQDETKSLEVLFQKATSKSSKSALTEILLSELEQLNGKFGNCNRNAVLDWISKNALNEYEAYKKGNSLLKEALKISACTDLDLKATLHSALSKAAISLK